MSALVLVLTYGVPVLVAIYTWNYARWAWRKERKRGAVGLALIAIATVALPLYMLYRS